MNTTADRAALWALCKQLARRARLARNIARHLGRYADRLRAELIDERAAHDATRRQLERARRPATAGEANRGTAHRVADRHALDRHALFVDTEARVTDALARRWRDRGLPADAASTLARAGLAPNRLHTIPRRRP